MEKVVKSEIKLDLPFMASDLVYNFNVSCSHNGMLNYYVTGQGMLVPSSILDSVKRSIL
jgi:hypothetical protein